MTVGWIASTGEGSASAHSNGGRARWTPGVIPTSRPCCGARVGEYCRHCAGDPVSLAAAHEPSRQRPRRALAWPPFPGPPRDPRTSTPRADVGIRPPAFEVGRGRLVAQPVKPDLRDQSVSTTACRFIVHPSRYRSSIPRAADPSEIEAAVAEMRLGSGAVRVAQCAQQRAETALGQRRGKS